MKTQLILSRAADGARQACPLSQKRTLRAQCEGQLSGLVAHLVHGLEPSHIFTFGDPIPPGALLPPLVVDVRRSPAYFSTAWGARPVLGCYADTELLLCSHYSYCRELGDTEALCHDFHYVCEE